MGWLNGDVAIVTGGGSGLGEGIVARFVEEGAHVVVLEKSPEKAARLEASFPGSVACIVGNVALLIDNMRAVERALDQFGKLDILVANAGIWDGGLSVLDLPDASVEAAFDEVFAVNVRGALLGAKAAARELARTQGNIILTISNAGFYAGGGGPIYTASKHAMVGLVRQLAHELAPKVRVNAVAPGAVPSDLRGPAALSMDAKSLIAGRSDALIASFLPLATAPRVEDYPGSYVLLASRDSSRITTGAIINADGGLGVRGITGINAGLTL